MPKVYPKYHQYLKTSIEDSRCDNYKFNSKRATLFKLVMQKPFASNNPIEFNIKIYFDIKIFLNAIALVPYDKYIFIHIVFLKWLLKY